jgi:hypothetical protein
MAQFVFPGQVVLDVSAAVEDCNGLARLRRTVAASAHPISGVFSEELEPLVEASLVQQPGFPIEKLLYRRVTSLYVLASSSRVPVRHLRPAVGRHQLRPASIKLPMIALAHAEIAGPGIEVMVEALMPEPHLSVQERPAPANRAWRRGGAIAAFRQLTSAHCGANHLVSDVLRAFARSDWRLGGGACRQTSPVCSYWKRGHAGRIGPLRLKPTPLSSEQ